VVELRDAYPPLEPGAGEPDREVIAFKLRISLDPSSIGDMLWGGLGVVEPVGGPDP
jgi:hypothetical protein